MSLHFEPGFSLQEALDILEAYDKDDDRAVTLYIAPPESGVLTDEDSGEEDMGGFIDNLSGKQLSALAEIRTAHNVDDEEEEEMTVNPADDNYSEENNKMNNQSPSNCAGDFSMRKANVLKEMKEEYMEELKLKKKKIPIKKTWVEGDFEDTSSKFPDSDFSRYRDFSASDLFELFLDEDLLDMIEQETLNYALFKNRPNPNITKNNIMCFLAILIFSGYNVLPGKRYYWDSRPDMHQDFIVNAMRRNKFETIMQFFHCSNNNNPDLPDKMWKLRPLIRSIQKKCVEHFIPTQNLSYDESMIEYFGRHGCKQCIRGKPIRFGYKVWSLNSPNGYLINFDIYQGKSRDIPSDYQLLFGKSAAPLLQLIDSLPPGKSELPYRFYFDNLFTGFRLLRYLSEIGYTAIGTIRDNRLPKCCPLISRTSMKSKKRGYYEHAISKEDGILICSWHDNGVVSIATNSYGIQPVCKVKRYSQSEKKHILVDRPAVFGNYNESMGGTDRMDQNLANYRISIRGKKWYWPILTWLIDVCVHNAWQLRRGSGNLQPQLEFRRELVMTYLTRYGEKSKGPGRPMTSKRSISDNRVSDDIRYDGVNHLVVPVPERKRKRCAGEGCISVGRTMCIKCNIGLCNDCFYDFHTITH